MDNLCTECKGKILTGSELVERTRMKKPDRIVGLKPVDIKTIEKCPKCKKEELYFSHAIRYR